ncbi:SGNH/GDSL hydrolase family protein, partial [Tsukamurella pulmonis]
TRADRRSVVVIGASVSSGKAVSAPAAYPRQVGAMSGRNVYVSARVGAGYADGSMGRLTRAADLPARNPSLVVLQAGTNDVGASPTVIAGQVRQVVGTVRRQAPNAKIAVVTVFPSIHRGTAAHATDTAIIDAARSVDPGVVVISPLDEGWTYRAASDGHPGAAAHERLAERIAGIG